jgi:Deoxyribonuclease II/TIR domain/zinc-ribbon domain
MAFCQTCGAANSATAKFCAVCGRVLARSPEPITVFYSYSHKDEDLRNELEAHLAPLRRSGLIREWHDRKITAGQDWDKEISKYLESAELILFLISADFLNSSYIFDVEVKRALERQSTGQAAVVPVILRPVVWRIVPELGRLQALPEGARPVTEWPSADLAFVSVCEGIVAVVLARASATASKPESSLDIIPWRPAASRGRRRVLDAALPARVPLTKPSILLVLIRRTDSPGLRAIVEAEPEYDITAKDIDSQPLTLRFPVDKAGTAQPLQLNIKIESPQFEPRSQSKSIRVPPRGDSLPRVFFLTPTQVGPLLVNVEICNGDEMIAGCVLHSVGAEAAPGVEELPLRQSVASASLGTAGDEGEEVLLFQADPLRGRPGRAAEHSRLEVKWRKETTRPTRDLSGRSFLSSPFLRLTVAVAALFGAIVGVNDLLKTANRPASAVTVSVSCGAPGLPACRGLVPLLQKGSPVDWWFVFKLNSATFPECSGGATRTCPFGGDVQPYQNFSQQFVYASSDSPTLQQGDGCAGDTINDPIGATFSEVYNGSYHYVVWNDQFFGDPEINGCSESCGAPWGYSKGIVAWNDAGEGLVMQVSTPSWPASGSQDFPRKTDGNTLGCVKDNDVQVSQHFFALRLTKDDLVKVLTALGNASVVTDPKNPQIVNNGGPADIQKLVAALGVKSASMAYSTRILSTGVQLISKPSKLNVPPWQMVSAILGGIPLRTATWWASPEISTTTTSTSIACWSTSLGKPGAVEIATTGHWAGKEFGLEGGLGTNVNQAKLGVSTSTNDRYAIFGDMNQQGTLSGKDCSSSQNGRGGTFYVVSNPQLADNLTALISGGTAPTD